jgi:hypothetical protein
MALAAVFYTHTTNTLTAFKYVNRNYLTAPKHGRAPTHVKYCHSSQSQITLTKERPPPSNTSVETISPHPNKGGLTHVKYCHSSQSQITLTKERPPTLNIVTRQNLKSP